MKGCGGKRNDNFVTSKKKKKKRATAKGKNKLPVSASGRKPGRVTSSWGARVQKKKKKKTRNGDGAEESGVDKRAPLLLADYSVAPKKK